MFKSPGRLSIYFRRIIQILLLLVSPSILAEKSHTSNKVLTIANSPWQPYYGKNLKN